jgi:hypothetical protein
MPKRRANKNNVIIIWIREGEHAEHVQTLAYNSGRGPIRVYRRDEYDPRCNMGNEHRLPFFTSGGDAVHWCLEHRGQQCQLRESGGRKLFPTHENEYAEPDSFGPDAKPPHPDGDGPRGPQGESEPAATEKVETKPEEQPKDERHLSVVPEEEQNSGRAA